jgi:hypothetical protein
MTGTLLTAQPSEDEAVNLRRLLRWVAGFIGFPSLTIGLAFLIYEPREHVSHMVIFLGLAAGCTAVWLLAPRIAAKGADAGM